MVLDRSLINEPPSYNDAVFRWFEEFPIHIRHDFLGTHKMRMHVQPGIELNLTLDGEGTFVVGNRIMKQSPGQLLVFPGNLPHQVYIDPSRLYNRMVVLIDDRGLSSLIPNHDFYWLSDVNCHHFKLQPEQYAAARSIIFTMYQELAERKIGWQQMIISGLLNLAVLVRRSLETGKHGHMAENALSASFREDLIAQICAYIDRHLQEDLSLKKMADVFHLSPDHMIRTFKREKGITFHQYVLLQRVFHSKRLLEQHPEMSLTDIAYSVGFASSSQYSKTFKTISGQTPSEYRSCLTADT